ncbi:putative short chain dehydrogenase protein [Phaeoacremonium minimum UCRPA7]|uniref:Putative short chain dehydrogenase protein n=1 Tax=Phaeoacremonium minimum (strain UCR-PA7) TaxID=1286976 RepID=R8BGH1_PHAM7|nr:putative short chain dehydrogenase protein [Phaeoacremonium minimum UCRPA7]EON98384.1 putative short chain dehydrogenase protein [Phaeoacremonium minimum UCRPA7]
MSFAGETAYITGGASGIARSLATDLVGKGMKIFIADRNLEGAEQVAKELNAGLSGQAAWPVQVDVADWESQRKGFEAAVAKLGRIDYVFPIAGISELPWLPKQASTEFAGFQKPNLAVFEVNAYGPLYTSALAIQHFRRQEPNKYGFRGKIVIVSSACGFYYIPTLPIYTAAKHGIVGFTRAFGSYLPRESITLNTLCPTLVETGISTGTFYDQAREKGLLITLGSLTKAFEHLMGKSDVSGQAIEILPGNEGFRVKEIPEFTNNIAMESIKMATDPEHRAWKLHAPVNA